MAYPCVYTQLPVFVGGLSWPELPPPGRAEGGRGGCHLPPQCEGPRQLQGPELHPHHAPALRHQRRLRDSCQTLGEWTAAELARLMMEVHCCIGIHVCMYGSCVLSLHNHDTFVWLASTVISTKRRFSSQFVGVNTTYQLLGFELCSLVPRLHYPAFLCTE